MIISNWSIERSTTVIVLLFLITGLGLYSYHTLPRETMPEIEIPFVSVTVAYPGVAPEDMESLVTIPIERKLLGAPGVKQISSTSSEGASTITVEFEPDEPLDEAVQRVRDKVDQAKPDLPVEAEDAIVQEARATDQPVVFVNLTGSIGLDQLTQIAEDLETEIESLPGVFEVELSGEVEREIQIIVDPVRLAHYRVSLMDLIQLTQSENVNTPAGAMEVGEAKYLMRVPGEIKGADELRDLVVKQGETGVVYLRDLAEIRDGFKPVQTYSRLDGQPSITLTVTKRSGENVIQVADRVKALVAQAQESLPAGVTLKVTADTSKEIRNRVRTLEDGILSGMVLVVAVLFMFLGVWNAFFVALAIPISLLVAFFILDLSGITLNMVSLFSLMVALGMLVDNGIVVVENIHRHAEMGKTKKQAAIDGAAEVAWPVIGSTVTTIAAFFPMIFWPGMMGKFMNLLPKTVIVTLLASLFVGLAVNPALASVFTSGKVHDPQTQRKARHPFVNAYGRVLRLALHWRAATVAAAVTVLITVFGVYAAGMRIEFLPTSEPEQADITIAGPEGSNLDATDLVARQIEDIVAPQREHVEHIIANVGRAGGNRSGRPSGPMGGGGGGGQTSHRGAVTLDFPNLDEAKVPPSQIIQDIRHAFDNIVGAEVRISEMTMGPPSGPPVNIELSGEDFAVLGRLAQEIKDRIKTVPGLVDIEDDFDRGKPEVRVVVDRQQAKLANLNTQLIGATVQTAVNGRKAGEYRVGADEYDVVVRFPEEFRNDLSNLQNMTLINLMGEPIPFLSVAKLEQGTGLGSIRRLDGKRVVTISGDAEGRLGTEVLADVRQRLADMAFPPGYAINFTGENRDMMESRNFLFGAFAVALFLIWLVLITQFNSILQPLVIMSSVILSLAGVFFGLLIFKMPFGVMMTGIGCISLAGVVVNNAIVLVDFINKLRDRGASVEEAIIEAGKTRLRPVLLTAVTTILGLVPLAVGVSFSFREFEWTSGGTMTQFWGSMAIAIIFGLSFATILTLVVVPVLYSYTVSLSNFFQRAAAREERPREVPAGAHPVAK